MCTVTWIRDQDGYQVLCNRDEKLTRARALPPRVYLKRGVRCLAPVDGDFGGSWIATNELGVTVCLLNGLGTAVPKQRKSRGMLVLDLMDSTSADVLAAKAHEIDFSPFPAFTMAMIDSLQARLLRWDGESARIVEDSQSNLLTSSSFDPEKVTVIRRREFARSKRNDALRLYEFHATHVSAGTDYSPCMHRLDAETVSFSWIRVTPSKVDFFYSPDAPCRWSPGELQSLERN